MKRIITTLLCLCPTLAWAYRDRPATDGAYFSPFTSFCLVVFGIVIAIIILRVLFEFAKQVDWGGLFKGCFSIICVGGLLWFFVLLFFGRSCSSNGTSDTSISSNKSNIYSNTHTKCSNCNGTGIKEVLEINPNLYDSNGNIRPNQPTGQYVKVQCKVCNGKGYLD